MTVGEKINYFRRLRKVSQRDLGGELHISAQAVSKWERDLAEPNIATLKRIAKIFNISVFELIIENEDELTNEERLLKSRRKVKI